ncbi:MAG: hypothetical protein JWN00_444 [Actinomycetia bacterium]|jgi:hypothetical protein|nr:hypothetical protein [Actinomycetes bacterium]
MNVDIDRADTWPELPLNEWRPTKDTLHLYSQIVGKLALAYAPARNHWWHVSFRPTSHGYATRRMRAQGIDFQIEFDLTFHRLMVRTAHAEQSIDLRRSLSVAAFYRELWELLGGLGIHAEIKAEPYGMPMTTPFAQDEEHRSYDPRAVTRYRRVLSDSWWILDEFSSWFSGKSSPVQLFWHSFDLAYTRFSGARAPVDPQADSVTREAYSHSVISFGFWAGDDKIAEPAFYAYAAPEPEGLTEETLRPYGAQWATGMALYPYARMRAEPDPRRALLDFLQSAYEAGVQTASWDAGDLSSSWCP